MPEKIVIIGNSITAEIVYGLLKNDKSIEIAAFSVNKDFIKQDKMLGLNVVPLETLEQDYPPSKYKIINAVGYGNVNRKRAHTFAQAKTMGYTALTYIHPNATVLTDNIGEGVFIMPGAIIEPHASIDENAVIWSNAVIAHHATIGQHCWIASGTVVSGSASVGNNSFLGVNSTVVNEVLVAEFNFIGAGALISKNTSPNDVYLSRSAEKHRFDSENYAKLYCV